MAVTSWLRYATILVCGKNGKLTFAYIPPHVLVCVSVYVCVRAS